jgi:nucleoside-diphosphate-sugar epimerase
MSDQTAPVLVTGAAGYVASWIVRLLLESGRSVRGTVRDPDNEAAVGHLRRLPGAKERLKLFRADLLAPGSFDTATQGCELVLHTASPFFVRGFKDAESELVRPAVEGTRNVLESVNRAASVKRVVLTSSIVAIFGDNCDALQAPGGVLTEAQWNTTSSLDHQPYAFSKVCAEREAWRLCEAQKRWTMVAINPGFVLGPSLTTRSRSESLYTMRTFGNGKLRTGVPHLSFACVDVRDVAQAHLLAAAKADAEGRYIVCNETVTMLQMADLLRERYGRYPLPKRELPKFMVRLLGPYTSGITREFVDKNVGYDIRLDNSRSRNQLGLSYRPLRQTLNEHFQQLIDDGVLPRR